LHAASAHADAHGMHESCTGVAQVLHTAGAESRLLSTLSAFRIFRISLPTPRTAHGACAKRCARRARVLRKFCARRAEDLRTALRTA